MGEPRVTGTLRDRVIGGQKGIIWELLREGEVTQLVKFLPCMEQDMSSNLRYGGTLVISKQGRQRQADA